MLSNQSSGTPIAATVSPAGAISVAAAPRSQAIDALRGFAVGLMVIYHFSFDLNYFRFIHQHFNSDPFWLGFRGLIVTLFLFTVGMSLQLARRGRDANRRFWTRFGRIAGCATLVSFGSYLMFPRTFIYFGILHFIALASVLARPLARFGLVNVVIGAAVLIAGNFVQLPLFDSPWLSWIGLMTHKPATEDYVPLLPWFGLVALGLYAGERICRSDVTAFNAQSPRPLSWLGRHSLAIYMLHQPILIGAVWLARSYIAT